MELLGQNQIFFIIRVQRPFLEAWTPTSLQVSVALWVFSFLGCSAWASCCGVPSGCRARALGEQASAAVARGLSCSVACGIILDREPNLCHLHCRCIANRWITRGVLLLKFIVSFL